MSTVLYVGMDVHSTSYSLATFALGDREARFELKIEPDYEQVLQYLGTVRRQLADALGEVEFVCGYEAGCLGDTLYHQLTAKGIKCVIVAPTTILEPRSKRRVKTDRRDAEFLARLLATRNVVEVDVPDEECEAARDLDQSRMFDAESIMAPMASLEIRLPRAAAETIVAPTTAALASSGVPVRSSLAMPD